MLQRDYFLRLIEEFAIALTHFLEKKKEDKDDELKDMYRQYVGDYTLLRNLTVDELITYAFDNWKKSEVLDRLEIVAELLYAEASYKVNPLREILLKKSLMLFDWLDKNNTIYSIKRKNKIANIKKYISN